MAKSAFFRGIWGALALFSLTTIAINMNTGDAMAASKAELRADGCHFYPNGRGDWLKNGYYCGPSAGASASTESDGSWEYVAIEREYVRPSPEERIQGRIDRIGNKYPDVRSVQRKLSRAQNRLDNGNLRGARQTVKRAKAAGKAASSP